MGEIKSFCVSSFFTPWHCLPSSCSLSPLTYPQSITHVSFLLRPFKSSPIHFTLYAIKYVVVKIVKQTMNQEWSKSVFVFVMADYGKKRASAARNNAAFKFLFRFISRQLVSLPSVGDLHKILPPPPKFPTADCVECLYRPERIWQEAAVA